MKRNYYVKKTIGALFSMFFVCSGMFMQSNCVFGKGPKLTYHGKDFKSNLSVQLSCYGWVKNRSCYLSKYKLIPIMRPILKTLNLRPMSRDERRCFDLFYNHYANHSDEIRQKFYDLNEWKKANNMTMDQLLNRVQNPNFDFAEVYGTGDSSSSDDEDNLKRHIFGFDVSDTDIEI